VSAAYADAAATYHRRGWGPFPVGYDDHGRLHPARKSRPPAGWTGYGAPYPSGADVHEWATNGHGGGNVALRMPETVIGIDVDAYSGKPGAETLAEAEARLGPLPTTPISTSRDDGVSGIRFYRVPAGRCWADGLGPGVELVHHGHRYAVVAPSVHPEGRVYRWVDVDGRQVPGPAVDDLPDLPPAWVTELDRGSVADRAAKAEVTGAEQVAFLAGMAEGEPCPYISRVLSEGVAELRTAASRHDTANRYIGRLVRAGEQGHVGAVAALDSLEGAFRAAIQADPLRPVDRGEWPRSVAGAVGLVSGNPTPDADRGCCSPQLSNGVRQFRTAHGREQLDDDLREGMHSGQLRMAYRLANSPHRDRLLHVHGIGWLHWDGKRWASDDQGHAVRAVRDVLRRGLQASLDLDADAAKAIRRDVDKCSSATGAAGVLALAASMAPFAATVADLDADPYLINCANGTLDLRTLTLRDHDPADRCTKVTAAAYRPDATGGPWHTFLERVLPDPQVRAFLQRLTGVALLGRVVEHVLPIATGVGANGKGVFTRSVEHALGDYASTAESDLFMSRDGAHPTGEMDLLGRRWVTVSETDHGRRLAEATMKRLTGGDTIKARRMRQDFVEFTPSHTPLLVTNHLPAVRGDDPAIWRRVRVVPFDVVIPDAEQDKHLDERLQLQADAILTWAVAGWRDYTDRGGLDEPEAVKVATRAYRLDSDPIARFLNDECIPTPHGYVRAGELWSRWVKWAEADGAPETSRKVFGLALGRKGYDAGRGADGSRVRRGIVLAAEGEDQ